MDKKRLGRWERLEHHCRRIGRRAAQNTTTLLWIAVPVFGTVAVIMTANALRVVDPERSKLLLSIAGYLAGLAAFAIGLTQYRRADYWKRCEFLAREMKEFFADPKVNLTLTMIDWGVRRIKLLEAGSTTDGSRRQDSGIREVNRAILLTPTRKKFGLIGALRLTPVPDPSRFSRRESILTIERTPIRHHATNTGILIPAV